MIQLMLVLVALSPIIFLIGLVKPGWILFWTKQPDRLMASSVGILMFMATFTGYSEMKVRHKAANAQELERLKSPERSNDLQLDNAR
ncbi:MAG: hypothetical protein EBT06_00505 [Gammaproteobacteria bacterium]|nr:hypothetical protein [Gammaproteobacteria bacterium]NBT43404.1 hypothetical protein [Gammaproteobacteria bacterium]NBY22401.1 hypothetical protein [Gammaproteobacteria bacterium]NDE33638.1 hypothetical protein [Gammaproteobacteria bacterium]NDE55629.1 hypothetical protein [Gammaproteobacteria bacterium]